MRHQFTPTGKAINPPQTLAIAQHPMLGTLRMVRTHARRWAVQRDGGYGELTICRETIAEHTIAHWRKEGWLQS